MIARLLISVAMLVSAIAPLSVAHASAAVDTEYTRSEFISENGGLIPGVTNWLAFKQEVREGWHVFWINPGDAGLPLELDWTLPDGVTAGDPLFPIPEYIPVGPLASYAHEGEPVFLIPLSVPDSLLPGQSVNFGVDALWQTCEEICVPEEATFSFSLPVIAAEDATDEHQTLFTAARNSLPDPMDATARFSRNGGAFQLEIDNWDPDGAQDFFFFPEFEGLTTPAAEQSSNRSGSTLSISIEPGWIDPPADGTIPGVLTFVDERGDHIGVALDAAIDGDLAAPAFSIGGVQQASNAGVGVLLLLAFFGGVILNAMPCVFPIVFVKAASLMHSAQESNNAARRHGVLYTAGILATFILIGGLLLALRAGGAELGWGFHLQSPLVIGLSAYILFLVGLNLAGVFSVGQSIAGAGESLTRQGGDWGAFFTGALAVVVAAPCIGPLLSAPMGAALLQPPAIGMLIFVVLALGLAAPYLALSFVPTLGRYLPKPGAWMETLKQLMAFPVFAAAAYFVWVIARQAGDAALAFILAGAVLMAFAAWGFERSKGAGTGAMALRIAAAVAAVAALAPLSRIEPAAASVDASGVYGAIKTEPFNEEALASYHASATPVFIDFTAAWCVTCQFNKLTVLKSDDIADAFKKTGTVFMVADWTVRDPEITEALAAFGASGVPLYVYYPPGGEAQILPQTLSKKIVLSAVNGEGV